MKASERKAVSCAEHTRPLSRKHAATTTNELTTALRDLLTWAEMMGGWDTPCWRRAETILRSFDASNTESL